MSLDPLNLLLNVSDKDSLRKICFDSFSYKQKNQQFDDNLVNFVLKSLALEDQKQSIEVISALQKLETKCILQKYSTTQEIDALFPSDFQANLKKFLCEFILKNSFIWSSMAANNSIILPRLVDFDWKVDLMSSCDQQKIPNCVLSLKILQPMSKDLQSSSPSSSSSSSSLKSRDIGLDKTSMKLMLDSMNKIKEQLNALTDK